MLDGKTPARIDTVNVYWYYTEIKAWSSCSNSLSFTSNEYSIQPVIESVSGDSCDLRHYTIVIRPTLSLRWILRISRLVESSALMSLQNFARVKNIS